MRWITALLALLALAGGTQALAPTQAAAMDDMGDGSCRPEFGFPEGVGLNAANEICFYEVSGGGDGQGGGPPGIGYGGGGAVEPAPTAPPADWWQKPEPPIEVSGTTPICDPTNVRVCLGGAIRGGAGAGRRQLADESGRGRKPTSRGNPMREWIKRRDGEWSCPRTRANFNEQMATASEHTKLMRSAQRGLDKLLRKSRLTPAEEVEKKELEATVDAEKGAAREARDLAEVYKEDWVTDGCGPEYSLLWKKRGRPPV